MGDTGNAIIKLFGGLLFGIGFLIATVSGLCTLVVVSSGDRSFVGTALTIGGIPFAIGVGLVLIGRLMLRGGPQDGPGSGS